MAPKSKSGPIRQAVALIKSRLVIQSQIANSTLNQVITTDADRLEFQDYVARLQTSIASLEERDKQWLALIAGLPDDAAEDEEAIYTNTAVSADGYLTAMADASEIIALLETRLSNAKKTANKDEESAQIRPASKCAKLPTLALPTFDGDRLQWSQFWSIFKVNVHETKLTGVEKLSYLLAQLKSSALNAIEGLSITDENYDVAIAILRKRFERSPDELIGNLYNQLKRLPKSSKRNGTALRV